MSRTIMIKTAIIATVAIAVLSPISASARGTDDWGLLKPLALLFPAAGSDDQGGDDHGRGRGSEVRHHDDGPGHDAGDDHGGRRDHDDDGDDHGDDHGGRSGHGRGSDDHGGRGGHHEGSDDHGGGRHGGDHR